MKRQISERPRLAATVAVAALVALLLTALIASSLASGDDGQRSRADLAVKSAHRQAIAAKGARRELAATRRMLTRTAGQLRTTRVQVRRVSRSAESWKQRALRDERHLADRKRR